MWPVVVVVDVRDVDRITALVLGCPCVGVEEILDEDPVVTLGLPVVTRRVGRDALMS